VLVVVALGGNALLKRGEPPDAETQRRNVRVAARAVSGIAAAHDVVVTHGNGPQVGLLALQALAYRDVPAYPLDVLGAESEGMLGYVIERELRNALPGREIATLLTMVEVAADDPAFASPTKPIGPLYEISEATRLSRNYDWGFVDDGGKRRRVVPSPEPLRILELDSIRALVRAGAVTICAGGGGVPVVPGEDGALAGVEGVIDKDLSAALLACGLGADRFLMLTDVDAVYDGWGGPEARPLRRVTPAALRGRRFERGTMAPKVDAACRFVEATGGEAGIGALQDAGAILAGTAGTAVRAD
jgi:carbamate kinase